MKKIISYIVAMSLLAFAQSCSLKEVNPSSVTSDKYFVNQDAYEELVNETYRNLRPLLQDTNTYVVRYRHVRPHRCGR
jgi:uncharacterized protein YxeA